MGLKHPSFNPTFGSGAPGANADILNWYFDTATTPYTLYIFRAAAWHKTGAPPTINATQLQGVNVSAVAPTLNQQLKDVAGTWTPQ